MSECFFLRSSSKLFSSEIEAWHPVSALEVRIGCYLRSDLFLRFASVVQLEEAER